VVGNWKTSIQEKLNMIDRLHIYLAFHVSHWWSIIVVVIFWQLNDYQMTIE
jgi:hypothetical protein